MPLGISVVIPTYNNAPLLRETLDSVLRQSCKDFELIVVDDGSTDGTAEIVKTDYPQARYLFQANRGPAAARNEGVRLAQSEYIAFCDHDDVWNERHLEVLLQSFSSHPASALAFNNAEYFGEGVQDSKLHLEHFKATALMAGIVSPRVLLWDYPVASMSVVMVKKEVFQELNGLSENVGALDDLHFYLRVAAHYGVRYVNYVGCKKRVTGTNLSKMINIKEINVCYLEDLWTNHPEVIRAIGPLRYRLRLARKYFKLGRYYLQKNEPSSAKRMFWKAYRANFVNLRYLWRAML
ncbi:MAG TPA: glycosyltransferase family 2 protein [Candidatus Binatia bacterium]|jgi:glycosyltransferase involved in cell wall biosynthesis